MDFTTSPLGERQQHSSARNASGSVEPRVSAGLANQDSSWKASGNGCGSLASGATQTPQPLPEPSLGNTAKSSSPPLLDLQDKRRFKRTQMFEGLSWARFFIFRRMQKIDPDRNPGDVYRTHDCRYVRRERSVSVKANEAGNAHYSGLATCGSVWACPLCAAVIQQKRRQELVKLLSWAYANDYRPVMVTFTVPHTTFDTLSDLQDRLKDAFARLRGGNAWSRFRERYGFAGIVRSLEVTHGQNGWHPHTHEIWLVRAMSEFQRVEFKEFIKQRWKRVCISSGLLDESDSIKQWHFSMRSVDVQFDVQESDYLAKQDSSRAWGVDYEIASQNTKVGRSTGVHPHEFLIRRQKGDAERYFEYINAMKGRRQIYWSPGLKELVGVVDQPDEELANEDSDADEVTRILGALSRDQWEIVRTRRKRPQVLDIAETQGWVGVERFLVSLGWDPYS